MHDTIATTQNEKTDTALQDEQPIYFVTNQKNFMEVMVTQTIKADADGYVYIVRNIQDAFVIGAYHHRLNDYGLVKIPLAAIKAPLERLLTPETWLREGLAIAIQDGIYRIKQSEISDESFYIHCDEDDDQDATNMVATKWSTYFEN